MTTVDLSGLSWGVVQARLWVTMGCGPMCDEATFEVYDWHKRRYLSVRDLARALTQEIAPDSEVQYWFAMQEDESCDPDTIRCVSKFGTPLAVKHV